ncbi:MAG: hypothetical protein ACR2QZ_05775 [Woeseiaceae bacterium]
MAPRVRVFLFAATALLVQALSACESEFEEPSAARKAFDELQQKYDELVEEKLEDPVQWAADDIENLGDWDYRVENLSFSSAEDLAAQLNEFGNDRWEVIWLERTPEGFLAVLKKPSVSYLSKIPLSGLGKIVIGGSDGDE